MRNVLSITKALADKNRLRILCALRHGELCVCQIIEMLELAPSTVSKHLAILAGAGLVESRKEGRWAYYRLPEGEEATEEARTAIAWVLGRLAQDPAIARDDEHRATITQLSPEELCQLQAQGIRCCSSAPETPVEARWQKDGPGCCGPE